MEYVLRLFAKRDWLCSTCLDKAASIDRPKIGAIKHNRSWTQCRARQRLIGTGRGRSSVKRVDAISYVER